MTVFKSPERAMKLCVQALESSRHLEPAGRYDRSPPTGSVISGQCLEGTLSITSTSQRFQRPTAFHRTLKASVPLFDLMEYPLPWPEMERAKDRSHSSQLPSVLHRLRNQRPARPSPLLSP